MPFATAARADRAADPGRRAHFALLRRRARQAYKSGRLEEALTIYEAAEQWARSHGTPDDVDRACCGRCALALELHTEPTALRDRIDELRRVLLRSANAANCYLASYNIARAYELQKSNRKAEFYVRLAIERARSTGNREWLASAHNLLGNLRLAESLPEEARQQYQAAWILMPRPSLTWRALVQDNLGYALVVLGQRREGFTLLYQSLRSLRQLGAQRFEALPRLSLSFAHLEEGRPAYALRHARAALRIGESEGDSEMIKLALYLVGQAANLCGDRLAARSCFGRLQREFYPQANYLPDFLLRNDVRQLVNLKA